MQNLDETNKKNTNESEIIDDHSNDDGQTMYVIEFESELGDKNVVHGGKKNHNDLGNLNDLINFFD